MVSHPETGSDSPIGSDRDRGRDKIRWGVALVRIILYLALLTSLWDPLTVTRSTPVNDTQTRL